jgi:hypothetical protein
VLEQNDRFSAMCKINVILGGNGATLGEEDPTPNSSDVTLFKYAPLTSCDIERSFSKYKTILSDTDHFYLKSL